MTEPPASQTSGPTANGAGDFGSAFAARLRGFGPVGLAALVVILLGNTLFIGLSGVLVLLWARLSGTPWREIGYLRPKSWLADAALGIVAGVTFKLVMKAVVMPLFGADPVNHAYHYLAGNRGAIPGFLFTVLFGAGFGEETLFRGYLFERIGKLAGSSAPAKVATVIVVSLLFGLAHYPDQGLTGAEQGTITGLVFGTIYMLRGRLPMLMIAHAAFDLTAYFIIYNGLETRVAHLIFK